MFGQSTGLIINSGGDLSVTHTSFMGNEEVQVDQRFANYLIGNMNGLLELTGNCFIENKVHFAPVVSHSDKFPTLSSNYGEGAQMGTCEFAAVFKSTATSTTAADASQSNYYCVEFDRLSCVRNPHNVATRDHKDDPDPPVELEIESKATSGTNDLVCMGLVLLVAMVLW